MRKNFLIWLRWSTESHTTGITFKDKLMKAFHQLSPLPLNIILEVLIYTKKFKIIRVEKQETTSTDDMMMHIN